MAWWECPLAFSGRTLASISQLPYFPFMSSKFSDRQEIQPYETRYGLVPSRAMHIGQAGLLLSGGDGDGRERFRCRVLRGSEPTPWNSRASWNSSCATIPKWSRTSSVAGTAIPVPLPRLLGETFNVIRS